MDVHEEHSRIVPKKMIVQGRHFDPMIQQRGHNMTYFSLCQYKVTHEYLFAAVPFRHREPAAKTERSRYRMTCNLHLQIIPGNVHLQHICLVVAFFVNNLQDLLIVARDFLSG